MCRTQFVIRQREGRETAAAHLIMADCSETFGGMYPLYGSLELELSHSSFHSARLKVARNICVRKLPRRHWCESGWVRKCHDSTHSRMKRVIGIFAQIRFGRRTATHKEHTPNALHLTMICVTQIINQCNEGESVVAAALHHCRIKKLLGDADGAFFTVLLKSQVPKMLFL